jgi:hypothetical protein
MANLKYSNNRPYYSTLTRRYYPDYDEAFLDSKREGGGVYVDFNFYYMHSDGTFEFVF